MPSVLGCREPRLSTPPLRALTRETSKGFEVIDFARDVLGEPLLPWQEELVIRALELNEDGTYRFRTVLCLVARQNGKTHVLRVLALWRLYLDGASLILSVAQSLDVAREAWQMGVDTALGIPELAAETDRPRYTNGEQQLRLLSGARWRIGAATKSAGRGLTVDLLLVDELGQQRTFDAWAALSKTTSARRHGQTWCISTPGDDSAVVLNQLHANALSGEAKTLGLFEWSAPDDCDITDVAAWAQANPSLGHTGLSVDVIRASLDTDPPAIFRTEVLCQRVDALNAAIPAGAWVACADASASLNRYKSKVAVALDVSPDLKHVTLVAAAVGDDGRTIIDVVDAWDSTEAARAALPAWVNRIRPRAFGWLPSGPAAAMGADLAGFKNAAEVKGATVAQVCQEFAELVTSRRVLHNNDALLNAHAAGVQKVPSGDGWRFDRREGQCDAVYAAATAAHLARTLPKSLGQPRILLSSTA